MHFSFSVSEVLIVSAHDTTLSAGCSLHNSKMFLIVQDRCFSAFLLIQRNKYLDESDLHYTSELIIAPCRLHYFSESNRQSSLNN